MIDLKGIYDKIQIDWCINFVIDLPERLLLKSKLVKLSIFLRWMV